MARRNQEEEDRSAPDAAKIVHDPSLQGRTEVLVEEAHFSSYIYHRPHLLWHRSD